MTFDSTLEYERIKEGDVESLSPITNVSDIQIDLDLKLLGLLRNTQQQSYFAKIMSTHSNPFVQGGWATPSSRPNGDQIANPPSVYGALPMTTEQPGMSGSRSRGATHFQFTNPSPTVLNSIVVSTHRDGSTHQVSIP